MTRIYCLFIENNYITKLIIIVFFLLGCTEKPKHFELLIGKFVGSSINYVKFNLTNSQKNIIKWYIYSIFFNDTVYHTNLPEKTTIGELEIDINRALHLDRSFYKEVNLYIPKNLIPKLIVVSIDWYSNDTIIGVKNQSKIVKNILIDSTTLDLLIYKYYPYDSNEAGRFHKFEKNQNSVEMLKNYLNNNRNVNSWFRSEAIKRGYIEY